MIFNIELLPGTYGDSILIEYGQSDQLKRILIDGGTGGTRHAISSRFAVLDERDRNVELIVITHIDRDHIEGVLRILEQETLGFGIRDVWFNGWKHLQEQFDREEAFGAEQGEYVSAALLKHGLKWNADFGGHAVVIKSDGQLPTVTLPGGMKLTLLSPSEKSLRELSLTWIKDLKKEGLVPGFGEVVNEVVAEQKDETFGSESPDIDLLNQLPFDEDHSEANASSIAFIAEYGSRRVLFLGDAQPTQIFESLKKIQPEGKIKIDLCKISHHASRGNTSPAFLELLDCSRFAISTNGSNYYHPHPETIARIIKRSSSNATLYFNYHTEQNGLWDADALKQIYNYATVYGTQGIKIEL